VIVVRCENLKSFLIDSVMLKLLGFFDIMVAHSIKFIHRRLSSDVCCGACRLISAMDTWAKHSILATRKTATEFPVIIDQSCFRLLRLVDKTCVVKSDVKRWSATLRGFNNCSETSSSRCCSRRCLDDIVTCHGHRNVH
jgi:hypothetical protein